MTFSVCSWTLCYRFWRLKAAVMPLKHSSWAFTSATVPGKRAAISKAHWPTIFSRTHRINWCRPQHLVWPVTKVWTSALAAQHCHHRLFKGTGDVSEMSPTILAEFNWGLLDYTTTGWWFQPIWKICSSNWIISPSRGEIKKNWNHHLDNVHANSKNPQIQWGLLFWRSWPDFEVTLFSG